MERKQHHRAQEVRPCLVFFVFHLPPGSAFEVVLRCRRPRYMSRNIAGRIDLRNICVFCKILEAGGPAAPGVRVTYILMRLLLGPTAMGPRTVALLDGIERFASIASAARFAGIGYRQAWQTLQEQNRTCAAPIVVASRGGSGRQRGARLTTIGKELRELFRATEGDVYAALRPIITQFERLLPAERLGSYVFEPWQRLGLANSHSSPRMAPDTTGPRADPEAAFLFLEFSFDTGYAQGIGPRRIAMLEQIGECASIGTAAAALGKTYRQCWVTTQRLNTLFRAPLITTMRGGRGAGGAKLTQMGKDVVTIFRDAEWRGHQTAQRYLSSYARLQASHFPALRLEPWQLASRTALRNAAIR